jgi:hypothetical protein
MMTQADSDRLRRDGSVSAASDLNLSVHMDNGPKPTFKGGATVAAAEMVDAGQGHRATTMTSQEKQSTTLKLIESLQKRAFLSDDPRVRTATAISKVSKVTSDPPPSGSSNKSPAASTAVVTSGNINNTTHVYTDVNHIGKTKTAYKAKGKVVHNNNQSFLDEVRFQISNQIQNRDSSNSYVSAGKKL